MKKAVGITAGIVVVVAAGWLGATWYTGKRIEAESPVRLAEVNQKLADAMAGIGFGIEIRQLEYQRNLFSSHARYAVAFTKSADAPDDLPEGAAEFVSHIQHGPFPQGALTRGHWLPKLAFVHAELGATEDMKPLFELTKGATPLKSDTLVSYNGDTTGTAEISPIEFTKDGMTLSFSGGQAEGAYVQSTRNTTGSFQVDRVALDASQTEDPAKVSATGISLTLDSREGQFGFGIGNSEAQIQRLHIEDLDTATNVVLQSLGYTAILAETGKNLSIEMRYQVGKVDVNERDFGQGQAVIKLDRLDGQAMADLSKLYNEVLTGIGPDGTPFDGLTPERKQALLLAGRQMLAGNPSLKLEPVTWKTAKGESTLTFNLDLIQPAALDTDPPATDDPQALIQQAIKALNAKLVVSKPMIQDIIAQVLQTQGLDATQAATEADDHIRTVAGMAEMLGVGQNDGDNLVSTFQYADGAATLNGNPMPVDELLGNLLGGLDEGDDYEADSSLLGSLDPDLLADILDEAGYSHQTSVGAGGNPVIEIDATHTGAASLRIDFNDCDVDTRCSDLLLRATFRSEKPISLRSLNDWNTNNRWTRAYLDTDNQAVLEMDVNAYGGIGDHGADYLVKMFLASVPQFADNLAYPSR